MTDSAIAGLKKAFAELDTGDHVRPDHARVAVVGHSLGGAMAMNLAAMAKSAGLPQPRAVMCVQPGDAKRSPWWPDWLNPMPSVLVDCSEIPAGTLVIVLVGDRDIIVGDSTAEVVWQGIQHLPAADRAYVTVRSDGHGYPRLRATHMFPAAVRKDSVLDWTVARTDALDYYGTWRLFDALIDAAFYGKNRKYALGNTPEQRHMGTWSDGTPVRELEVMAE
jgi:pimeloyl-ACP methyl ester carboxylesterase